MARGDGRPKILGLLRFHCAISDLGKLKIMQKSFDLGH